MSPLAQPLDLQMLTNAATGQPHIDEMAVPYHCEDSELGPLNTLDVDKAFEHIVRWLRNEKTARYFEKHPAARDTIATAVQEVTRLKPSTPAPTPYNVDTLMQSSTPLASQHGASPDSVQEVEGNLDDLNDSHENRDLSAAQQQELRSRTQPDKQANCGHQHLTDPQVLLPDYSDAVSDQDDVSDQDSDGQDTPSNAQSPGQTTTSRSRQPNTTRYRFRRRANSFGSNHDVELTCVEVRDTHDVELTGHKYSQPDLDKGEQRDQQPATPEYVPDNGLSMPAVAPTLRSQTAPISALKSVGLPRAEGDRFSNLPAELRAKLHMIGDTALTTLKDYIDYMATRGATEGDPSPDTGGPSNERLRMLKDRIVRSEAAEESVKYLAVAIRISKRAALAELIGWYIGERDARTALPKKRRRRELPRLSPKNRLTDLLFPETKETKEQDEAREVARMEAKGRLNYWISIGEPLAKMAQRFGYGVLLLLPLQLTDKDLHHLPRPQIQDFLDFIDSTHPDLKEKAGKLLHVLVQTNAKSSPRRLLLDHLTCGLSSELRTRRLEDLFQFAEGPVDSGSAGPAVCPVIDEEDADNQVSHSPSTVKPGQGITPDCTSESFRLQPPNTSIEDRGLSDASMDRKTDADMDKSFSFQDGLSPQPESRRTYGSPEPQDYYSQDEDWRARPPPGDFERAFPDSQDGVWDRSSPDFSDFDSFCNLDI